jgi:YfiR/HmsC-like
MPQFKGFQRRFDQRGGYRIVAVMLVWSVVSAWSPVVRSQVDSPGEYEIKAAFLFNFAKFIDWPASSFKSPTSPFAICILGRDPFGSILDTALQGRMIGGRPLLILRLKDTAEARQCQMAFVSSSENSHLAKILEDLRGLHVSLVGEADGFAASGGTIQFTIDENHVRFTINTDAADRAGLKFSAKLLALATIVHDEVHSSRG